MTDVLELKKMCLELMETGKAAYLTTVGENSYPQIRAMLNLRNKEQYPGLEPLFKNHTEDFMSIFSTNTSSPKVKEIKNNRKVSTYYCKPSESRGVMFGGEIEIIEDPNMKKRLWQEGWERYYPSGYDDPDHTVLKLKPVIAKGWDQNRRFYFEIEGKK